MNTDPLRNARAWSAIAAGIVLSTSSTAFEFTDADRAALVRASADYEHCLREQLGNDGGGDARQRLDAALGTCTPVLDAVRDRLAAAEVDAGFLARYARSTRERVVRRLLPELMAAEAARNRR